MIWKLVGIALVILGFVLFIKGISNAIRKTRGETLWLRIGYFFVDVVLCGIILFEGSIGFHLISTGLLSILLGLLLFFNIIF